MPTVEYGTGWEVDGHHMGWGGRMMVRSIIWDGIIG